MSDTKVALDSNSKLCRGALRLDVLLLPYWGLFSPAFMAYCYMNNAYNDNWYGIPLAVLCPVTLLVGGKSLELMLKNRLIVRAAQEGSGLRQQLSSIMSPVDPSIASITLPLPRAITLPLSDLKAVSLERKGDDVKYLNLKLEVDSSIADKFRKSRRFPPLRLLKGKGGRRVARLWKQRFFEQFKWGRISNMLFDEMQPTGRSELVVERIALARLKAKESKNLVQALERFAPQCKIDDEARNFLLGRHKEQHSSARQVGDKLEIHYHSHEKVRKFFELLGTYEWLFWRVFLLCCIAPIIAFLPFILWYVPQIVMRMFGLNDTVPPTPWFCQQWMNFFSWLLQQFGNTISGPGQAFFNTLSSQPVAISMMAVSAILLARVWCFVAKPNRLILGPDDLTLECRIGKKKLVSAIYKFEDFSRITLQKPKGQTAPDQWRVCLHYNRGRKPLELNLGAIKGADRESFLRWIENNAPQISRDPELIETLMPAQKASYTELWLQALSTPPKRERLAPLTAGQVLRGGRYLVEDQLGTGGQGIAYLASRPDGLDDRLTGSGKIVVKEFILPVFVDKLARRQALERFEKEATLLQTLDHPRVVKLVDYFIEDHRGYLVLEHINGWSLRKLVEQQGPLSEHEVLSLARQMCDILSYLHSLVPPLVHRDFTPDNLILNEQGVLKLIDFNVAHQSESKTKVTVVGKHAYLPPEQFRGKPVPASDIYAMGATLHYLLTGEDPDPVTCSHPILINENISKAVDDLVAHCTALELSKRFVVPTQIAEALNAIGEMKLADIENRRLLGEQCDDTPISASKIKIVCKKEEEEVVDG